MIRKNEETGKDTRRVSSFKKFSEISSAPKVKEPQEDPATSVLPEEEGDRPGNPNLPYKKTKLEKPMSTDYMMPKGEGNKDEVSMADVANEANDVEFYGKIAKLPKGTKASKGYNFLENVKVPKSSIWYIMVEKQENELQMVKYNFKKGVDLNKFVTDLKVYYKAKYAKNPKMVSLIENIQIDGNDKYSWIKNIPIVEVEGKKLISKITEDLIKLLSK